MRTFAVMPACLLAGCASVTGSPPMMGGYAEVDVVPLESGQAAVDIQYLQRWPEGKEYHPGGTVIYLRPGEYVGYASCGRPAPGENAPAVVKVGTADGPNYDFLVTLEAGGTYKLDCHYEGGGPVFTLDRSPKILNQ